MIPLKVRKEIFMKRFINYQSFRSISKELDLNRGSVTNICKEISKKIKEMRLELEPNLIQYIDQLVPEPKCGRKSHKVNPATKRLIRNMVKKNEMNRTRNPDGVKTIIELYSEFQTKERNDEKGENMYRTDISYGNFYKIVRKIKEEFLHQSSDTEKR